ncbi:MAG: alcohol dehydrogenase catalytic domain-containing protein, partial [bacterium]|nr:alcohol dehydrogenase catalytic domain-containing protein [bacterium]
MDVPATCRAAVYDPDRGPKLDIREFSLRPPNASEILVRITLSAICGSDRHTVHGRRRPRGPIILGHEICGRVALLGEGVSHDKSGHPLQVGDRVTWSIAAGCGTCFYCTHQIPQKCESLFKYGHESIDVDPPLNGGFAEYVYLMPGTAVFRVPATLDDTQVVFANCSLATMTAAVRLAEVQAGDAVLIQGAGMVGLCAAAICANRDARAVMVTDVSEVRLKWAEQFGATHTFNPNEQEKAALRQAVEAAAGKRGFDVAIEVCGQPDVLADGLESLRIGGRYVLAGCVFPGAVANIDLQRITTHILHLIGLHNYTPADLQTALTFLTDFGHQFAFDRVV